MKKAGTPRWIYYALVLVVVVAAALYLPIGAWWSALSAAVAPNVAGLEVQLAQDHALASQVPRLQARLKAMHPGAVAVPAQPREIAFLTELSQDAAAAGVQITATNFGVAAPQGGLQAIPVTVQVNGAPTQTASFLRQIEGGSRLVVVASVNAGVQSSQMTLNLYYH